MTRDVPQLMVVTERHAAERAGRTLRDAVAAALAGGAPAVLLRERDLPRPARRRLGEQIRPAVADAGAALFVSADVTLAFHLDADGLHLPASAPSCPDPAGLSVGRSCHDDAEVVAAREEGVAYAFVSPVAPSASKPGYGPALGAEGVRRLVSVADGLPLLVLGGVTPENAPTWRAAGASGMGVMGAVMSAHDPARAVRGLLTAWQW